MTLRTRLIILLSAFALFALGAASATIYGVKLYVNDAIVNFQSIVDHTGEVESLKIAALEQAVRLREVLSGRSTADEAYRAHRDAFFTRLDQVARYAPFARENPDWAEILSLSSKLRSQFDKCLALAQIGDSARAYEEFDSVVEADLWPALDTRLQSACARIDAQRTKPMNSLLATNTQLLVLAAAVGVFGAALVGVGATLIRRWLIIPVASLKHATQRLGQGELDYRVTLTSQDELADLGASLNQMAESLVAAQEKLHVSESKFRSLFENLRDAVLICDSDGKIVEHHDGDRNLLRSAGADWRGRPLAELWPLWFGGEPRWSTLLEKTLMEGRRTAAVDLEFHQPEAENMPEEVLRVDLVAYRVEYGRNRYAAIVLRDANERHELQRRARQAEAMKATISFAQGIAHDFNNLLTSGINTLTRLKAGLEDGGKEEQAASALGACWQAARLARRLLDFAGLDRGNPQTLRLSEAVAIILNSLDESFFYNVRLRTDCHGGVLVYMDPDQLTQVVLNLLHNAREAMPEGGALTISVQYAEAPAAAATNGSRTCARLIVEDSGCGMSEEVKQKLFEPFFSTKPRASGRRRGLGLAVVYAIVRNADGVLEVESQPGHGTRFSVFLPCGHGAPISAATLRLPVENEHEGVSPDAEPPSVPTHRRRESD